VGVVFVPEDEVHEEPVIEVRKPKRGAVTPEGLPVYMRRCTKELLTRALAAKDGRADYAVVGSSRMKNRFARVTLVGLFTLLALLGTAEAAESIADRKDAAVAAAKEWLVLVDEGKYAETWDAAAELFQNAVPKGQWVQQLGGARRPLGKVLKRELRSKAYKTSLPGAPDGEYVVIQFEASFADRKAAVETVTPMLEKDGRWRVSGYFIR